MRTLNRIIVHCTDSPDNTKVLVDAKTIDKWHRSRGWAGIGYHFVILRDGKVESGRPVSKSGAHVRGHNRDSIGIVLVGRRDFTAEQFATLQALITKLWAKHGMMDVFGHKDFTKSKTCPNFNVATWVNKWKKPAGKEPLLCRLKTKLKNLFG